MKTDTYNVEPMKYHKPAWELHHGHFVYRVWAPVLATPGNSGRTQWHSDILDRHIEDAGGHWKGESFIDVVHSFPKGIREAFRLAVE